MDTLRPSLEDLTTRLNALGIQKDQCTGVLRAQIAALTAEAEAKEAPIEVEIADIRRHLEARMMDAQMPTLKTARFTFSVFTKTVWDAKGLDNYASERPEIRQFCEEKTQTRLQWKV